MFMILIARGYVRYICLQSENNFLLASCYLNRLNLYLLAPISSTVRSRNSLEANDDQNLSSPKKTLL